MLGAGSILAGVFIGAGIGALSTTAMKEGEEISTGNVRSAGERLAYAVFDDSMSWDEKWAYAFDPGQMVADFVTGVVIGEILDGIMAATQNKLRSIFANYDATMREAIETRVVVQPQIFTLLVINQRQEEQDLNRTLMLKTLIVL